MENTRKWKLGFASGNVPATVNALMKIAPQKVVAIEYTLTDAAGKELDSSRGMPPLEYLHGFSNIIPGLERELEGLAVGEEKNVVVQPEHGYGVRDERLIAKVPRDRFDVADVIEVGMRFHAQTPEGVRVMTVAAVDPDGITLDGNHELAGQVLHFAVRVAAIREATAEELEHGHPHQEGGCCGGGCGGHGHHRHPDHDPECDGSGDCDGSGECKHGH